MVYSFPWIKFAWRQEGLCMEECVQKGSAWWHNHRHSPAVPPPPSVPIGRRNPKSYCRLLLQEDFFCKEMKQTVAFQLVPANTPSPRQAAVLGTACSMGPGSACSQSGDEQHSPAATPTASSSRWQQEGDRLFHGLTAIGRGGMAVS